MLNEYWKIGDIKGCLDFYYRSLYIYEQLGFKRRIAANLSRIGFIYKLQGDFEKFSEYTQRSSRLYEELGDKSGIAACFLSLGTIYSWKGEIEKSIKSNYKAIELYKELGDKVGIAVCLNNIGVHYYDRGEFDKCLDHYYRSLQIYKDAKVRSEIVISLINIGWVYYDKGNLNRAETYATKAMKLSKELGFPDKLRISSLLLYNIYCKTKKHKDALFMYELYIQMRDSIKNESTQKAAIKLNMQYEYEKQSLSDSLETAKELALKDIEISKQNAEAKAERTTKYGLYGGLALVLIIAFVLARSVKQKKKANEEISLQKQEVENSKLHIEQLHKEVTDSIHYAAHIQNAILTSDAYWQRILEHHFILFKPRDIVSGDFYWAYETPTKKKIWIAADCTGHGVPGGFMSMLGNTFLNEIAIEQGEEDAAEILNKLRDHIIKALASDVGTDEGLEMKDGMDISLCILHPDNTLEYSEANNPLWVFSLREELYDHAGVTPNEASNFFLHEVKADKQPIGKYTQMTPFTSHKIKLETGDQVYTFSDGFPDQFGGPKLKKYMSKRLKKFLFSITDKSMEEQKGLMHTEFEEWRKDTEQVDDVCVIGVKV